MSLLISDSLLTNQRESQEEKKYLYLDHSENPKHLSTWVLYASSMFGECYLASALNELFRRPLHPVDARLYDSKRGIYATLPTRPKHCPFPQSINQRWMLSALPRDSNGRYETPCTLDGFGFFKIGRHALQTVKSRLWTARYVPREQHVEILGCKFTILLPRPYRLVSITQSHDVDLWSFVINLPPTAMAIINRANPGDLIDRMFPFCVFPAETRYIASCFWSWLCVLDGEGLSVCLIKLF